MESEKVGLAIKKLRMRAGYTQQKLADLLGVTDKAVSKWERGISVPDISNITKLSILLNCDVDILLEGNITYIETTWQGLLILDQRSHLFAGTEVYGKPLVYIFLSYFILAGIRKVYISGSERDIAYIEEKLGDGSVYGMELHFLPDDMIIPDMKENTMVVSHNPFVYGPNLTKYFQRAMARNVGVSVLTIGKMQNHMNITLPNDTHKAENSRENESNTQFCTPFLFFPKRFFKEIEKAEKIIGINPLYAEPIGNGMIVDMICDEDSLWETAGFIRYLKKRMGIDIYNIEEIARNRYFI